MIFKVRRIYFLMLSRHKSQYFNYFTDAQRTLEMLCHDISNQKLVHRYNQKEFQGYVGDVLPRPRKSEPRGPLRELPIREATT